MDGSTADHPVRDVLGDLAQRLAAAGDGRLPQAFLTLVTQIHAVLTDLRPSIQEVNGLIDFLTEVGHSSDTLRQEWVLLADVIGVSARVEDMNTPRPPGATPNTGPGPFYRDDVPELDTGADLSRDGIGAPLWVTLRLNDLDGLPVPGARVEVWQANQSGRYENQDPDLQPEFNLRGRMQADDLGVLRFRTVKPGGYDLPKDGPVGRLLGTLGLRLERPAHIHVRVCAPGYQTLTTQIFDSKDPAIAHDALFGVRPELIGEYRPEGTAGYRLDHTLVLVRSAQVTQTATTTPTAKDT